MAAAAAAWCKSAVLHDSLRVCHTISGLHQPDVNIVHIQHQHRDVPHCPLNHVSKRHHRQQAHIMLTNPQPAAESLVQHLPNTQLQTMIYQDVCCISQYIAQALHLECLNAKLEIITSQSCPNWHADHVGVRCLCSYVGPGTWYIANRHVKRQWGWLSGDVSVVSVDDSHAVQAGVGDMLYLKGHSYPGLLGDW
eukprot:jgi/Chrzof1/4227/Cz14g04010.t1